MRLQDKRPSDKPREKLAAKGSAALSDLELLMAIFGSGNAQADVTKIARDVQKVLSEKGSELAYEDLCDITGMGPAKATQFMAAFELWRRQFEVSERPVIDSTEQAILQLTDIRHKKQEYFVCLSLDGANRLIAKRVISIGTLTSSLVHPREVFADAITDRAASIIVAHNHPSGSLAPSRADIALTTRLQQVAELLGIALIEHILITETDFTTIDN